MVSGHAGAGDCSHLLVGSCSSHTCQGHATPKANISPYGNHSLLCCQVFKERRDANCSPLGLAAARSLGCQRVPHSRPLPSSHPLSLHRCSGKQDQQLYYWVVKAALGRRGPLYLLKKVAEVSEQENWSKGWGELCISYSRLYFTTMAFPAVKVTWSHNS